MDESLKAPQGRPAAALSSEDWATARGQKWAAQAQGMEAMLSALDQPLLQALPLNGPWRMADVGCGSGQMTIDLLKRVPAGTVIHGYDIAPASIEMARARIQPGGPLAFAVADMASAAAEEPYDLLVSRLGIIFFSDPAAAFANLRRWLKPGGSFAFVAWARPDQNPWFAVTREVVAAAASLPALDPAAPGPFRYADVENLLALLRQAGFSEVRAQPWEGSLAIGGGLPAETAAAFALAAFSNFSEVLSKAGEGAPLEAQRALTARYSEYQQKGIVRLGARVHVITGKN